jgi:hypothetical protein
VVDRVMAGLDNIGHEHAGNRFAYGNVCYLRRTGRQCCGAVMQTIDRNRPWVCVAKWLCYTLTEHSNSLSCIQPHWWEDRMQFDQRKCREFITLLGGATALPLQ